MLKAYKYRIYPSKAQIKTLRHTLELCCELYNAALQERRDAWKTCRKSISYFNQNAQLPEIKKIRVDLNHVHSNVLQDVLRRIDKAFNSYFRRVKAGDKSGFPRFRSNSRYTSFSYVQSGFALKSGKLYLSKIGMVKIKLHRPIEGKMKTCTVTKSSTGKWYACIVMDCESQPLPESNEPVGVDVGIKTFAHLSTGEAIGNPKFLHEETKELARTHRKFSAATNTTKKGSPEREKRRKAVARVQERIANKRRNFAHQESRKLVNRFSIIVFEKLDIVKMLKNHDFAKNIMDAAWGQFITFTRYKAEDAGRRCIQVNPYNTTKTTACCGVVVSLKITDRIIICPKCGSKTDRDWNSSINILRLGLQSLEVITQKSCTQKSVEWPPSDADNINTAALRNADLDNRLKR